MGLCARKNGGTEVLIYLRAHMYMVRNNIQRRAHLFEAMGMSVLHGSSEEINVPQDVCACVCANVCVPVCGYVYTCVSPCMCVYAYALVCSCVRTRPSVHVM